MGTLLLGLLHLATSGVLAWVVARLGHRPSRWALLWLTLLPLPFTYGGFLPGKVLAPTVSLAGVPPWAHPDLTYLIEAGSSTVNPLLVDPLSQMEPWRQAARRDWLFNPAASSGAALLGNGQSAVLFPIEGVARMLPPVRAATYVQTARLLLAAWGLFLLLRAFALAEGPALLGATAWVSSGFLQLWRLHTLTYVAALTPWILFALFRLARKPSWPSAALLASIGALGVAAGHPETLLQSLLFGLLLIVPTLAQRWRHLRSVVGWGVLAALLAALLAAPVLLPFVENLTVSSEWQHRQEGAHQEVEMPFPGAFLGVLPALDLLCRGDPLDGTWDAPGNLAEMGGSALPLAALMLLVPAFRRRPRHACLWIVLGLVGLMVSSHFPWISRPFGWLPLISTSLLNRLQLWWVLGASVGAAFGAAALARGRGRKAALTAILVLAALLMGLRLLLTNEPTPSHEASLILQLILMTAVVGLCRRRLMVPLLTLLILLPSAAYFSRWVPTSSALSFYPRTPAVEYVAQRAAGYRVTGLHSALLPHSAAFFGLEDIRGYDPMSFGPYEAFTDLFMEPRRPLWNVVKDWRHPALDFLGVRFLFDHPSLYIFHHPGVLQVYEGEDALVYENPHPLPRAYLPETLEVVEDTEAALRAAAGIEDFGLRVAASGAGLGPPGVRPNGSALLTRLEVERRSLRLEVEVSETAVVATSQPAIPGWRLMGKKAGGEVVRINGAFLGLRLPPGHHEIHLRYAPRSWTAGWWLFAAGLLLMTAMEVRRRAVAQFDLSTPQQRIYRRRPSRPAGAGITR